LRIIPPEIISRASFDRFEEGSMASYRLYSLDPFTGHFEGVEIFHASDDVGAICVAQERAGPVPLELWCDGRKVARVDALPEIVAYSTRGGEARNPRVESIRAYGIVGDVSR
jgi:hypothetical protein